MATKGVLLLNLGTPEEPTAKGLRKFYKYFFSDPYVFDFNAVGRWLLRNLIIIPFRAPKTAKDYATIWMDEGSPLKVYADRLLDSVQKAYDDAGEDVLVLNGMGYSEPFIWDTMAEFERRGVRDILVMPLFPQYSTATTESVFHGVRESAKKWKEAPNLKFVDDLYAEPAFISAWADGCDVRKGHSRTRLPKQHSRGQWPGVHLEGPGSVGLHERRHPGLLEAGKTDRQQLRRGVQRQSPGGMHRPELVLVTR